MTVLICPCYFSGHYLALITDSSKGYRHDLTYRDVQRCDFFSFYLFSAVKGKTPQVGDRVLVEAVYNPNMPFKWNAQRIQTLPQLANQSVRTVRGCTQEDNIVGHINTNWRFLLELVFIFWHILSYLLCNNIHMIAISHLKKSPTVTGSFTKCELRIKKMPLI